MTDAPEVYLSMPGKRIGEAVALAAWHYGQSRVEVVQGKGE